MKRTITIDDIERVPVDKISALVTSIYNDIYKFENTSDEIILIGLPAFRTKPRTLKSLIDTKRGCIKIIGYAGNSKWYGKCDCGNYVIRNGKAWRKGLKNKTTDFGCVRCNSEKNQKRSAKWYSKYGVNKDAEIKPGVNI